MLSLPVCRYQLSAKSLYFIYILHRFISSCLVHFSNNQQNWFEFFLWASWREVNNKTCRNEYTCNLTLIPQRQTYQFCSLLTENGSTLSQEMGAPQDLGRTFSGSDSGINTKIKSTSNTAIDVASHTTKFSLYIEPR